MLSTMSSRLMMSCSRTSLHLRLARKIALLVVPLLFIASSNFSRAGSLLSPASSSLSLVLLLHFLASS